MATPPTPGATGPTDLPPEDDGAALRDLLRGHLGRVDEALRQWDAWEANLRLPPAARPPLLPPAVSRQSLTELRELLLEELARLDAEADAHDAAP